MIRQEPTFQKEGRHEKYGTEATCGKAVKDRGLYLPPAEKRKTRPVLARGRSLRERAKGDFKGDFTFKEETRDQKSGRKAPSAAVCGIQAATENSGASIRKRMRTDVPDHGEKENRRLPLIYVNAEILFSHARCVRGRHADGQPDFRLRRTPQGERRVYIKQSEGIRDPAKKAP